MGGHTFEEIKSKWDVIFKDPLLSLTSLRDKGVRGNVCSFSLRSVCWKLYLSYLPSLDISTWTLTLHKERQHYADLRQKYITSPVSETENDNTSNDLSVNNPLSLDQANPWQEYFKDTELRKIIRQDVERTFPDNEYFRNPEAQNRLLDILFIYCKMNTDVSYRQGMHELLAPILWVVDDESIPGANGYAVENDEITIIRQTLNSDYVEHDTFVLFSSLMKAAKINYEYNDEVFNPKLTPVVMKCNKIHEEYLQKIDPDLYHHLKDLEIEPQLYGIRWVRLLFGREFPLEKVLILWDGMFAEDPALRIVDFVCLVPDSLVHVTKNVFETVNTAMLNKAIYSVVGEVKKNLGNSRNRHEQDNQRRQQNSTSDFINRKIYSNSSQQVSNDPLRTERIIDRSSDRTDTSQYNNISIKNNLEEFTKLREQNRQMSIILQKSIDILEQEILGRTKSQEDTDKIEKSSEGSTSRSSFEYVASNNNEESSTVSSDGISVLNVLHGLKHIRDVLNGSTKEFNSNILDLSSNTSNTSNNSTEDEISSIKSINNTKQEKSIVKTEIKSIPSSSSEISSSPLSRNIIDNSVITSPITTTTTTTKLSTQSTPTTSTTSRRIHKHSSLKNKLNLEDILSDVENSNGTPKSSITSNSKYSWMIGGYTDDDENSLFNPKRASIGSVNSLSSYASGSGYGSGYADYEEEYLKKISPTTTTTTITTTSTQRLDPLGAFNSKNIGGRNRSENPLGVL
ncbi:11923_t:CDS:10 [Diversispora eburnea]|uniref:11923_t:CDS:1 n=1 Tax=Diversispora eburnea TaxID=1213867 RepID=A0A9N8V705_9GLOM|nr:11923_t:CDS:10 [Diversispora eburnea]